jgi:hypothetical protein
VPLALLVAVSLSAWRCLAAVVGEGSEHLIPSSVLTFLDSEECSQQPRVKDVPIPHSICTHGLAPHAAAIPWLRCWGASACSYQALLHCSANVAAPAARFTADTALCS